MANHRSSLLEVSQNSFISCWKNQCWEQSASSTVSVNTSFLPETGDYLENIPSTTTSHCMRGLTL